MSKKIYSLTKIKYWRCYSVEELAKLLEVHEKTILEWKRKGLKTIDSKQPFLFYGYFVKEFLGKMNLSNKCKTAFDQIFCMKCQEGRDPLKKQIQFIPVKQNCLKVKALCRTCKSDIYQNYKLDDLPELKRTFNVVQLLPLYDCKKPSVNTPFSDQGKITIKEPQNQQIQGDFFL